MEKPTTLPKIQEADLDLIAPAAGARSLKRITVAVGVVLLVGSGVMLARGHGTPAPVATVEPAVTPAPSPEPASAPVAPVAQQVAKPDAVIAAAIESPHEEIAEPKSLTAADHLRIARGLEREAAKNRRLAALEYRKQAAHYRQLAQADRRKAQNNARVANTYQRLAQRSVRRGA